MIEPQLIQVACAFFRLSPLLVVSPIALFLYVPILARLVICIAFACLLAGLAPEQIVAERGQLAFYFFNEFLIGVALTLGIGLAFGVANFFSQLIDLQIGFSAASVFDPASQQMQSSLGMALLLLLTFIMITTGFFETLLAAFFNVVGALPLGSPFILKDGWYKAMGIMFSYGFALFSPVVLALFLLDVCLAVVSRSMPQAQIYFVALPLKVFFGLFIFAVFTSHAAAGLLGLLNHGLDTWDLILRSSV